MASPSKRSFGVKKQEKTAAEKIFETPRSRVMKRMDAIRKEVSNILTEIEKEHQTHLPLEESNGTK